MRELHNLALFFFAIAKALVLTGLGPAIAIAILAERVRGFGIEEVPKEFPYVYRWLRCLGLPVLDGERKGQPCRVLVRGRRNSCLIEFPDGLQAVTSRNALRRCRQKGSAA